MVCCCCGGSGGRAVPCSPPNTPMSQTKPRPSVAVLRRWLLGRGGSHRGAEGLVVAVSPPKSVVFWREGLAGSIWHIPGCANSITPPFPRHSWGFTLARGPSLALSLFGTRPRGSHVVLWGRRTRRCRYRTGSVASWGLCPETAKYILPSIWLHCTSSEIPSCPLCWGWMTFSPFPRGRQHGPVPAGREERHSPRPLPGSLPRSPPDKEQGAGKHWFPVFAARAWRRRCDVLDSSWKGIIFEYGVYCLWNSTWRCFSSLGALGNRHSCQYSFWFIWLVMKCEQTFGFGDVRGYRHVPCLCLRRQAQTVAGFRLPLGSREGSRREAGGRASSRATSPAPWLEGVREGGLRPSERTSHHQLICKKANLKRISLRVIGRFSLCGLHPSWIRGLQQGGD